MKDRIQSEVSAIYDKIQREGAQSLKRYNDDLKAIERQTKRSWAFVGIKEALFWCMCLSMLLYVGNTMLNLYGFTWPILFWQISYPLVFIIPICVYIFGNDKKNH